MPPIRWTPEFKIGIPEIDHQHQQMIELLNRIHDGVVSGHGREILTVLVEELERHTERHFAAEERLMAELNYPQVEAHRDEHRTMLDAIHAFCDECVLGHGNPRDLIRYFDDWFLRHLRDADRQLGESLGTATG